MWGDILPVLKEEFGVPIFVSTFKGLIHPDYYGPSFLWKAIPPDRLFQDSSAQILHDGRNRIGVVRFVLEEDQTEDIVIKQFRTRGINKIKSIIWSSKAHQAWRGGMALLKKDIPTPLPVAFVEKRRSPFVSQSFYFSRMVKGVEEIRFLFRRLQAEELRALIQALASYLRRCHEQGILHRDLSDGNLLVRTNEDKDYTFYLIDTNRIRTKQRIQTWAKIKNLIRLGVPAPYQRYFLQQYLQTPRVEKVDWFWYRLSKRTYTGYVECKKKLGLKKAASKLGLQ